jgi:putative transposase
MLTRNCTQRQYLLRPDPLTNRIFDYCVAEAAKRHSIDVILPSTMTNHHHTTFFDRHGNVIEFMERFHKIFAKAQNAHRGRRENLWASEAPSLVLLETTEDVIDKLVYAATNPVRAGLVEHAHQWPGVNGLAALLKGRKRVIRRPSVYFRSAGTMAAEVTLELVIPPELGDPDEIRAILRSRVADVEALHASERKRTGARVLGRRGVLQQSWKATPASERARRDLRPLVAARSVTVRVEALARRREFLTAYRSARECWLAGRKALFPPGTYWLRRFAHVSVADCGARSDVDREAELAS